VDRPPPTSRGDISAILTAIASQTQKKLLELSKNNRVETRNLNPFLLDERLARDSQSILELSLCDVRLSKDSRWPWLILVPRRANVSEVFDLSQEDQQLLWAEQVMVAKALQSVTQATKINIAAIGNVVRQLHVHVVARFEGDANWPAPIWGFGTAEPYSNVAFDAMKTKILGVLHDQTISL
jgi:diadenosine tetraphosphate (Ap4A) HIT family hydrolase